uniref:Si:ch211-11n16.2 n=1 Tax=Latimeria chalumnae TaxID=7897 RepID=H3BHJ6_LATCH
MSDLLLREMEDLSLGKPKKRLEGKSFLLVNENEILQVKDEEDFVDKLGCVPDCSIKVLSIFGNTGDGKSHTLNWTFFESKEVFSTSPTQDSCTVGVWAAYNTALPLLVLDTEGLLGTTANQNQRNRLLLKVLAVSDIVVYRTHAERLHNDMFQFLGSASQAYLKHFTRELRALSTRCGLEVPLSSLGPSVIIFHETSRTELLGSECHTPGKAETLLKKRFHELHLTTEAFSSVLYVGVKTIKPPTDFAKLQAVVKQQVQDTSTRSPRSPAVVYNALKVIVFGGECLTTGLYWGLNLCREWNTAVIGILFFSYRVRCGNRMNHLKDNVPHMAGGLCQFAHQYSNKVLICKKCYEGGREVIVVPKTLASTDNPWIGLAKYAWSGYVLECPVCGIIYRSRQYWMGNLDPEGTVVRSEVKHVWPGTEAFLTDHQNAAQRVLDGVNFVVQSVTEYSSPPTKAVATWLTDQVAPTYWRPNALVTECHGCKKRFEEDERKHHCRACGEGFCHLCSSKTRPVPERGWGTAPVRVCSSCYRTVG